MPICTSCGKGTLSPIIKSKPYLIVKEQVTQNELDLDTVFTFQGQNKYGKEEHATSFYLQKEMGLAGLQMNIFSLSNLYMHVPPKVRKGEKEEISCLDFSIQEIQKLAIGKKIVMLMGAETIKVFTGYNASSVYGLVCKSDLLPDVPVIVPAPNPDKLMNSPIGELRNALKVLREQIKIYEEYKEI